MKKVFIILLTMTILFANVSSVLADIPNLPGYEDAQIQKVAGTITIKFLYPDGTRGYGTYKVFTYPGLSDAETIRRYLEAIRTDNETYIYAIIAVNNVPIEKTKWAKYGGPINWSSQTQTPPNAPIQSNEVFVYINGEKVVFPDQQPLIKSGRTMVPMRSVFEHYYVQAEIQWEGQTKTVTAKDRTGTTIIFRVGDKNFDLVDKDGVIHTITNDVAPELINGRTMLPLRALAEALNFQVDWIADSRVVDIKEKDGNDRRLMDKAAWERYLADFNAQEIEREKNGGVSK